MKITGNKIQLIRDYFRTQPVLKAFLFGSHARDEASDKSDVDILVELDYSKHIGMGFLSMKHDLEAKLHQPVDVVSANGLSKFIKPFIERDKILIYEK